MSPKKKFGQNFITDKNLINKILRDAKIEGKNVIEVGPGRGALTEVIASTAKKVIAYEIDSDLSVFLDELTERFDNLNIIYEDFLQAEFTSEEEWELIGNLPYYITTPIIFKFLENNQYNSATIMIQKEVGDRIISGPNSKKYNALSVIIQYLTKVTRIVNVSRKMFYPIPNVDSVVIRMEKHKKREISLDLEPNFFDFVKGAFAQKRKTLVNNLSQYLGISKSRIIALLKHFNYKDNIRAEQLNIEDFIVLFRGVYEEIIWKSVR